MFGLLRKLLVFAAFAWIVSFPLAFFIGGVCYSHPDRQKVNLELMRGAMRPEWDITFLGASREVRIPLSDRVHLSASVFGGNSWATVIVMHRADQTRIAAMDAAYALWRGGFDVVLVDRRAHGSSDGDLLGLFGREAADVSSLIDRITQEHWTGTSRIGVFGIGDAGTTCLLAAAKDDRIDAVVAADPAVDAAEFVEDSLTSTFNVPAFLVALQARVTVMGVAMVCGLDSKDLDARPLLKQVTVPVFLLRSRGTPAGQRVAEVATAMMPRRAETGDLGDVDDPDRYVSMVNFFRRTL